MSNTKRNGWRAHAEAHAQNLEWQVAVSRLMMLADTPEDAIAVAADVVRAGHHVARSREARARGHGVPVAPPPISKLLTGFTEALRSKVAAVAALLPESERNRLRLVAPGFVHAIEDHEPDVVRVIGQLLPMSPDAITLWVRMHLDIIEKRFAS